MAGVILENCTLTLAPGGTSGFALSGIPPAGKYESNSLMVAAAQGSVADGYIDVFLNPNGSPAGGPYPRKIIHEEPVRCRQPGGNPVLLLNFILSPNTFLVLTNTGTVSFTAFLFNRWQFDA